jgi:hypothetical protein
MEAARWLRSRFGLFSGGFEGQNLGHLSGFQHIEGAAGFADLFTPMTHNRNCDHDIQTRYA